VTWCEWSWECASWCHVCLVDAIFSLSPEHFLRHDWSQSFIPQFFVNGEKVSFKHDKCFSSKIIFLWASNHQSHNFLVFWISYNKMILLDPSWCHQGPSEFFWSINYAEVLAFNIMVLNKFADVVDSSIIRHIKCIEFKTVRQRKRFLCLLICLKSNNFTFFLKLLLWVHNWLGIPKSMFFHQDD